LFATFRVMGSVLLCWCLQCKHFQVGDGAGGGHVCQYVHLCSTLFVHWTVSLICVFDLFLIHPCCLWLLASFLALHLFVSIDFYVSGGG
jgi:hypothetical protein